jgi:glycosyltransferase involved in cell wall biosynthesis
VKIAQIAPLAEAVPPKLYGGTERIVSNLTEELVRQGHDVTLFASADSCTSAELVPCAPQALRLDGTVRDPLPHVLVMLEEVRRRAEEFEILHFHLDMLHFPIFRHMAAHTLTTLHGRLDLPDLRPFYRKFPEFPLVSISNQQRWPMPPVNWAGTVYHGLPTDLLHLNPSPQGDYLAFLGRISPEKGPDRAIEIARRANMKIRIAAKVDSADQLYFEQHIRPLLDDPLVEFIGEISEQQKSDFLGNASALLFPVNWPEPFGIVMIEAMACGTPVIAWPEGSVPEVIDQGTTGFMVQSVEEAVAALDATRRLDRTTIRRRFEQRFSAARMARDYVALYRTIARKSRSLIAVPQIPRSPDRAALDA